MSPCKVGAKFIGKKEVQISELESKVCSFYSIKAVYNKKANVNHHILLVDVSGSMYNEIDELKIRLKSTLDALKKGKNNYVSVILYSGHEETFRIVNAVKCDAVSYKMAQVYEVLESEIYSRGVTVMSEPLEVSLEIVKTLADICNKHHIVLFTDGCLVPTRWSSKIEEEKCFKVADLCNEQGIFLDAIGFGQYYDRDFLIELIDRAGTGEFVHIDEVIDYFKTITSMCNEVNSKELISFNISNDDYFIMDDSNRCRKSDTIKVLRSNSENIVVTFDNELLINDKVIKATKKIVEDDILEDFFYSLSLYHVKNEDIESGEITIAQTEDIGAYASLANCHSFLEKGKVINLLTRLIEDKDKRFKKGRAKIKVQDAIDEPLCLLEVLKEILEDEGSKLLWDYKYKYKRIGMKTKSVEDDYIFNYPKEGYGRVTSLSIGSKKLNIGVKVEVKGNVQNVNSKLKLDAVVYRDYNLVVNGNINTTQLWCELSKPLKAKLRKEKLIKRTIKTEYNEVSIIDLTKLKATNKRLLKLLSQKELAEHIYEIEVLECKQTSLKSQIADLIKNHTLEESTHPSISEEESEVRKIFRVDENGIYKPLRVCHEEGSSYEIYPATVLEWKIDKFPRKKELDKLLEEYKELRRHEARDDYEVLTHELYKVKKELNTKRNVVNIIRLSCGLTGKSVFMWEDELEKSKKESDKTLNMNMVVGEKMTVSSKIVDGILIRQNKYTVLTKCT